MDQRQNAGAGHVTMGRRELIILLGGAAIASPLTSRAQQKTMPVIGFLSSMPGPHAPSVAFRQGLSETGYIENKNVAIEYREAEGRLDLLAHAADLVSRRVDVIAAAGPPAVSAAKKLTSTIPIVFTMGDPVEEGFVDSLAQPGGNLTGVSLMITELMPKRLELLTEVVPQARVIALLVRLNVLRVEHIMQDAARAKGVELPIVRAGTKEGIDTAFASMVELKAGAVVIGDNPFFNTQRRRLVALSARYALPTISAWREFPASGGLISYGASLPSSLRQLGIYTGKILSGVKPADLPVEQPAKFELVINLKTANALGLTLPQSLLARADEVIE